jgi:hypothetical protein
MSLLKSIVLEPRQQQLMYGRFSLKILIYLVRSTQVDLKIEIFYLLTVHSLEMYGALLYLNAVVPHEYQRYKQTYSKIE